MKDKINIESNNIKYMKAAKSAILCFHYLVKNKMLSESTLDSFDIDYGALDDVAALMQNVPACEMEIINKVLKEVATKDTTFLYDICGDIIHIYTTNANYWKWSVNDNGLMYGYKARLTLKDKYGLDYKIIVHDAVLPK